MVIKILLEPSRHVVEGRHIAEIENNIHLLNRIEQNKYTYKIVIVLFYYSMACLQIAELAFDIVQHGFYTHKHIQEAPLGCRHWLFFF